MLPLVCFLVERFKDRKHDRLYSTTEDLWVLSNNKIQYFQNAVIQCLRIDPRNAESSKCFLKILSKETEINTILKILLLKEARRYYWYTFVVKFAVYALLLFHTRLEVMEATFIISSVEKMDLQLAGLLAFRVTKNSLLFSFKKILNLDNIPKERVT